MGAQRPAQGDPVGNLVGFRHLERLMRQFCRDDCKAAEFRRFLAMTAQFRRSPGDTVAINSDQHHCKRTVPKYGRDAYATAFELLLQAGWWL